MKTLLFLFFLIPLVSASPLEQVVCGRAVKAQAQSWQARGEWVKRTVAADEFYYASPGNKVGEWIMVKSLSKASGISKISPEGRVEIVFSLPKCLKKTTQFAQPPTLPGHLSDKDLEDFVRKNPVGLIYLWSPHHLESRKGLDEIQKISSELKLPLLVLLDKNVPKNEYAKYQEDLGIAFTRKVDAVEIQMRQIENFPTTLIVKDGKIQVAMIENYKASSILKEEIEKRLKGTGR